ncbi:MAG: hypothetical protein MSG64_13155 [Pyrinomonadaceae bacterium MAG19_C2-C3]|nr:hypothetical protein [Pyrinomonadaceae bacterium MAG19_C2-C3]
MKNPEKILGAMFLLIAVFDATRGDWLGFALLGITGAGLLFRSDQITLPRWIEITLGIVIAVLLIARFIRYF